jgi:hypothetical protein
MLDLAHRYLSEDKARTLLRKLRDLNLVSGPIALDARSHVALRGCASADAPAEGGVHYRVHFDDGREELLEIQARHEGLELRLSGRRIDVDVTCDRQGRACARSIGARATPETNDARELEHFLRRIVRATFAST